MENSFLVRHPLYYRPRARHRSFRAPSSRGSDAFFRGHLHLDGTDQMGTVRGRISCLCSHGSPLLTSCASILLIDLIQLVKPEQLPVAVVE